jgi:hypothetical protein
MLGLVCLFVSVGIQTFAMLATKTLSIVESATVGKMHISSNSELLISAPCDQTLNSDRTCAFRII